MTQLDPKQEISLAVDTSGRAGSVCLGSGDNIFSEKCFSGMMRHAAELFPSVIELLDEVDATPSDIKNIFVTVGPGSFTGLRIGITLAKMMALAGNVRIASVSTLDVIAQNAFDYIYRYKTGQTRVAAIIDAKRQQFFVGVYELIDGTWTKVQQDTMMDVETFIDRFTDCTDTPIWLLGEGLKFYKNKFQNHKIQFMEEDLWSAKSKYVYKLGYDKARRGDFDDPQTLLPAYLRRAEAEENWEKKEQA